MGLDDKLQDDDVVRERGKKVVLLQHLARRAVEFAREVDINDDMGYTELKKELSGRFPRLEPTSTDAEVLTKIMTLKQGKRENVRKYVDSSLDSSESDCISLIFSP